MRSLVSEPPSRAFHKVYLHLHLKFLTKVVSNFHVNQTTCLPTFFLKPHTHRYEENLHFLDVRRALAFYLERAQSYRSSTQLFVAVADRGWSYPVSTQKISSWISLCICLCYQLANSISPAKLLAHSTRAQAASIAFLVQVPILDICKAATWSSLHTFTSQYAISVQRQCQFWMGSLAITVQIDSEPTLFVCALLTVELTRAIT